MVDIVELQQDAQRLKVTWKKAQDYYNTFMVDFARIKKDFEVGKYTDVTFPAWLFQYSGLIESRVITEINAHMKALSADDRKSVETENLRKENERRAAKLEVDKERQRIAAERLAARTAALEQRNKEIIEQARLNEEARALKEKDSRDSVIAKRKLATIRKPKSTTPRKRVKVISPVSNVPLEECAKRIHSGTKKANKAKISIKEMREIWIEGIMEVAVYMAAARNQFSLDVDFGDWTDKNNIKEEYESHEVSALIRCGNNLELYRKEMEETESTSIRNIDAAIRKQHLRVVGE